MKVLFLHGWQSVPGGVKPTYLKDHGYEVINSVLPDDDMEQAVRIAQAEFAHHQPQVVVGSSRGGVVAMMQTRGIRIILNGPRSPVSGIIATQSRFLWRIFPCAILVDCQRASCS